jgi:hypothetical protein
LHYPFRVPFIQQAADSRGTGFAFGTSFAQRLGGDDHGPVVETVHRVACTVSAVENTS